MPRDKTASHAQIIPAAKAEFLEKGYQRASIRSIAARAGLTSAGLYRHFRDKEDMFAALVEPALQEMNTWTREHIARSYDAVGSGNYISMWQDTEIDMMLEVVYPRRETFKLLLCCAQGTRYEHFIHNLVEDHQVQITEFLALLKEHDFPVREISQKELHMLLSAYTTALFEPVVHDYSMEDAVHFIRTVEAFFMPGWHNILGC